MYVLSEIGIIAAIGEGKAVAVCSPDDETGRLLAGYLKENMKVCFLRRFTPKEGTADDLPVYGFPEMDFGSADVIVLTDHYHLNKLTEDIKKHGFKGDILSFEELSERLGLDEG